MPTNTQSLARISCNQRRRKGAAETPKTRPKTKPIPAVKPFGRVMETWFEPPLTGGEFAEIPSEKKLEEPRP